MSHMQDNLSEQGSITLNTILAILRDQRSSLAARYHVAELGVFGSYVRSEQHPESDVDILVSFTTPPSLFTLLALEDELTALLGLRVDLAVKSALRPYLGATILREVVMVDTSIIWQTIQTDLPSTRSRVVTALEVEQVRERDE